MAGFDKFKGINVASPFKLQAKEPLDVRDVVETIADRDALVTQNGAYEGMVVYVKADKAYYRLKGETNSDWEKESEDISADVEDLQDRISIAEAVVHVTGSNNVLTGTLSGLTSVAAGLKVTVVIDEDIALTLANEIYLNLNGTGNKAIKWGIDKLGDLLNNNVRPDKLLKGDVLELVCDTVQDGSDLVYYVVNAGTYTAEAAFSVEWSGVRNKQNATTTTAGLMSAADKAKLDGIATGANKYTHPTPARSNTTSTQTATHGGTVEVVDSITSDTNGHVTKVNTKTVTLPTAPTTISGNAGSATKLQNKRKIDGVDFDGTADVTRTIHIADAVDNIMYAVVDGITSVTAGLKLTLIIDADIPVNFSNDIYLNINETGNKPIKWGIDKLSDLLSTFRNNSTALRKGDVFELICNTPLSGMGDDDVVYYVTNVGTYVAEGAFQAHEAYRLTNSPTINFSGAISTTPVDFNGYEDITIPVTKLDPTKLDTAKKVPIECLPAGALERLHVVADDTARFALTTATVQIGDTVKVTSSGKMYFIKDDTKLSSEAGYEIYTAGSATTVPWSGVTGKPGNASSSSAGFMSTTDKTKLDSITSGATKVEDSTINGNIKINGEESVVYTHPSSDGNKHVPATGTTNNNKVLVAGSAAGSATWQKISQSMLDSGLNEIVSDAGSWWNSSDYDGTPPVLNIGELANFYDTITQEVNNLKNSATVIVSAEAPTTAPPNSLWLQIAD